MTRRRRGRRPKDSREEPEHDVQPRVGPDGRPDERRSQPPNAYTPPPSPLTRWQHHRPHGGPHHGRRGPDAGRTQPYGQAARVGQDARGGASRSGGERGGAQGGGARARSAPGPIGGARYDGRGETPSPGPRRFRGDERPRGRSAAARPSPRPPAPGAIPSAGAIDPFELFCAYHLAITPEGGYRIQNIHEVARRFGTNAAELRQILAAFGLAADDIVHSGFDLPSAQVDIMVAPEGISRRELARPLYEEFRNAPKKTRDWTREMEDAQRQIDRTIERDGRWSPAPRNPAGKQ
ncbi:MAG: hypothetical protein IT294_05290 [Deltaproteobacteria bacterium]|nr:hypothetical protein [Deltaproteobacteria bacterium]